MNKIIPIIIVTWNSEKDIEECLRSVYVQDYKLIEVIVVDNDSKDNTLNIVREKFPSTKIIPLSYNNYLTGGNNIGIRYAFDNFNSNYLMVLNPDTKLDTNLVSTLKEVLDKNTRVGATGPKIKFWKSEKEGLLNSTGLIFDGFMQAYDRGFMKEDNTELDHEEEVFGVSGACIMYRVEALKEVGLYWNVIKMYMDEVEMFIRFKKRNWKVIYTPKTTLYHSYMRSTSQNNNLKTNRQKLRAILLIGLRHYPIKRKLAIIKKYIECRIYNNYI